MDLEDLRNLRPLLGISEIGISLLNISSCHFRKPLIFFSGDAFNPSMMSILLRVIPTFTFHLVTGPPNGPVPKFYPNKNCLRRKSRLGFRSG